MSTEPTHEKVADVPEDEEPDDDMDQLIADLESEDGGDPLADDDEVEEGQSARPVPEELLQTDPRYGLTSDEVTARRKKYGLNQMSEEKENLILKFCMYFVGPIQFVMEVCILSVFLLFPSVSHLCWSHQPQPCLVRRASQFGSIILYKHFANNFFLFLGCRCFGCWS